MKNLHPEKRIPFIEYKEKGKSNRLENRQNGLFLKWTCKGVSKNNLPTSKFDSQFKFLLSKSFQRIEYKVVITSQQIAGEKTY